MDDGKRLLFGFCSSYVKRNNKKKGGSGLRSFAVGCWQFMNTPSLRGYPRFFFSFGSFKLERWWGDLSLRSAFCSAFCYCVRSNTAPAFAGWPCASLKRAWRSTSACLSCTLCSPAGIASAACTACYYAMVCLGMRYALTRDFFFELGIWNLEFIKKLNYFFLICCVI